MGWLDEALGAVVLFLVLVLIPIVGIFARRRWLDAQGGVFDCSLRRDVPGGAWKAGIARYSGDNLEWFQTFSLSLTPRLTLVRRNSEIVSQREPDALESDVVFEAQRVVRVEVKGGDAYELALSPASVTGLMAWLEASPPGERYVG